MLHFILQTIAFQLFFLIIYDAFLRRETFFNWNRAYLLITTLLSIVLPFIKIDSFKEVIPQKFIIRLPEIILGKLTQTESNLVLENGVEQTPGFVFSWELFFILGATIAFILFAYKLIKLGLLINKNSKQWQGNLLIVKLINSNAAFSFFHYVFLGEKINTKDKVSILKHETIHVQHKHSIDLLAFEILRILFWFNPLVYMCQNRIRTLHEYIADAKAIKTQDKTNYYENLLTQVFETKNVSFINTFFKQSLIKKRITMLSQTRSKQILKFKYILLIPLIFGMLLYTSCDTNSYEGDSLDLTQYTLKVNVLYKYTPEQDAQVERNNEFLKNNTEYVFWTYVDKDKGEITWTIHHEDEKPPADYFKIRKPNMDSGNPIYYINDMEPFRNIPVFKSFNELRKEAESQEVEIPFAVIEQVPIFPGCETLSSIAEQRKCMADKITKLVQKNFNTDLAKELGLKGRIRISTIFKINKEGGIEGVRARAPHKQLEEEAIRVINLLPKMTPGKHQGEEVIVPYALPIIFQIGTSW